jgi:ribosome-binding factor A
MSEFRIDRVGHLIQEKIGRLIVERRIKDPRVDAFLTITRVSVSRDLSYADVYVSSYKSGLPTGVEGLRSAAGFIQSQLAKEMRIRKTPHLRFHEDPGIREGFEIVKKIEELQNNESRGQ